MIPLVGYTDRFSLTAGGTPIEFKISSDFDGPYEADLIRIVHGDPNPDGPGIKYREVPGASFEGEHPSRVQRTDLGSFAIVESPPDRSGGERQQCRRRRCSFTVGATIFPTLLPHENDQIVLSRLDDRGMGFRLGIGPDGDAMFSITLPAATGVVRLGKPMRPRAWYRISATVGVVTGDGGGDIKGGDEAAPAVVAVFVSQSPLAPEFGVDDAGENSAEISLARPPPEDASSLDGPVLPGGGDGGDPFVIAAARRVVEAEVEAESSSPLAVSSTMTSSSKIEVTDHFNGKIENPFVVDRHLDGGELQAAFGGEVLEGTVASWDFAKDIDTREVHDRGPLGLHGRLVNLPTRGVTGSNWSGNETCWRHAPDEYAAIYFHEDDLSDCEWETDFVYFVPPGTPSGLYGARLRCEGEEEIIPFYVRPETGRPTSDVVFLAPTFTYQIYANHARGNGDAAYFDRVKRWPGARKYHPDHHRDEYGASTYDRHPDGSGICHSTRLRPILTMRPGFLTFADEPSGSGLRHFPADTHILDWLEVKMGEGSFDVITDEDLDEEGVALLEPYRVVLTGSHPEYHTQNTLDALQTYVHERGGRSMYLGGNGFYWKIARGSSSRTSHPGVLEVRRGEGGIRAWAAEPGEYHHVLDGGGYGGLWRRSGRPPQGIAGVGFSAQGTFVGSHYIRAQGVEDDPRVLWMFDSIENNEILGDFGLSGGGAAGFELDRADQRLGTPRNAVVVASSRGNHHSGGFIPVYEEMLTHLSTETGESPEELVRADMVYLETANGGAVFSTGSITFCGSLSHNDYDNNISQIMLNVLQRFRSADGDK